MAETTHTGIILCQDFTEHDEPPDIKELVSFSEHLNQVSVVWTNGIFKSESTEDAAAEIKDKNLDRLVIVGRSPGMWKPFLSKAMLKVGLDPSKIILARFKQNGESRKEITEHLKKVIFNAVSGRSNASSSNYEKVDINPDTLVIGGGIAGIQASLEIANANLQVHLVEREATIGGHMAIFDKTFPTLDCAACILTPKMGEVGQHENINLLSYSEVEKVEGSPGNYKVTILRKARRVSEELCKGCGECAVVCPKKTKSEFDVGTSLRKAIYMPFPQAVPNKYVIDAEHCTYVKNGKCGVCAKKCPVEGCINLNEQDKRIEIEVGNIIVATGFQTFDAKRVSQYGYGEFPNVLTSIELERLINASGPTEGEITYRSKTKKGEWIFSKGSGSPDSIGIIHCVGSRDENYNPYCSKVCCMYSLKLAHLIKEKLPKAEVFEYYIDMRAYGKGYEEFYQRIKQEGVHIIRGRTAQISESNGQLLLRTEDMLNQSILEQNLDMVILSVGLEARNDAKQLAHKLNIHTDQYGWMYQDEDNLSVLQNKHNGISFAGVCQGPYDIPDSVAQGSAAAADVIKSIMINKINKNTTQTTTKTQVTEAFKAEVT